MSIETAFAVVTAALGIATLLGGIAHAHQLYEKFWKKDKPLPMDRSRRDGSKDRGADGLKLDRPTSDPEPEIQEVPTTKWHYGVTKRQASLRLRNQMDQAGNRSLIAVDDGVLLFNAPDMKPIPSTIAISKPKGMDRPPPSLKDPDSETLIQKCIPFADKAIGEYLGRQAALGAKGHYRFVVGATRVVLPEPNVGNPLSFEIQPLSYWTNRHFNRELLVTESEELLALGDQSRRKILRPGAYGEIDIPCPSTLFTSFALFTSDPAVLILRKDPKRSVLASVGLSDTTGIEESIPWDVAADSDQLDFSKVAESGARSELSILPYEIESFHTYGVAFEGTHLNTAVLGCMRLKVTALDLHDRIVASADFTNEYDVVPLNDCGQLFDQQSASRGWHPTARLRLLLALLNSGDDSLVSIAKQAMS